MHKTLNKIIHSLFRDVTAFGGMVFYGVIFCLTLLFQRYNLALKLFLGLLITFIIVILIRMVYFKNRPHKQSHANFIERIDASSFPSWHAARITFICLTFLYFISETSFTIFLLIFTLLVCYSRIYLRKHDWKDVIAGIILGAATYFALLFFI